MKFPVDRRQEGDLVHVDLTSLQARYLAPGASRKVAVLEIFRCENQGCEEHSSTALHGAASLRVFALFHGKVVPRQAGLYKYQVVEGYL